MQGGECGSGTRSSRPEVPAFFEFGLNMSHFSTPDPRPLVGGEVRFRHSLLSSKSLTLLASLCGAWFAKVTAFNTTEQSSDHRMLGSTVKEEKKQKEALTPLLRKPRSLRLALRRMVRECITWKRV